MSETARAASSDVDEQSGSQELNYRVMAGSRCEALVARKQWCIERFRKSHVNRIIGCEIVAKVPDARQKEGVRITAHGEIGKISESRAPTLLIDFACRRISTHNLRNFYVEQMGCVQRLSRAKQPRIHHLCNRRSQKRFEHS
jgi:hypothetical protein